MTPDPLSLAIGTAVGLVMLVLAAQGIRITARTQVGMAQKNGADALVFTAQAIGGGGWAKVMALCLALSVIATTGTGIVLTARIV